jgi:hypothetical protein
MHLEGTRTSDSITMKSLPRRAEGNLALEMKRNQERK